MIPTDDLRARLCSALGHTQKPSDRCTAKVGATPTGKPGPAAPPIWCHLQAGHEGPHRCNFGGEYASRPFPAAAEVEYMDTFDVCTECGTRWPCRTAQTIIAALADHPATELDPAITEQWDNRELGNSEEHVAVAPEAPPIRHGITTSFDHTRPPVVQPDSHGSITAAKYAPAHGGRPMTLREVMDAEAVPERALYHEVMQCVSDMEMPHGTCQPRERMACTHCNAKDRLNELRQAYRGPPIAALEKQPERVDWIQRGKVIGEELRTTTPLREFIPQQQSTGISHRHLRFMADQLAEGVVGSETKTCRWLGWLQAGLVYNGLSTLEAEKERNLRSGEPKP